MNGIMEVTLNGKKERLRFNQYARVELKKFFMPPDKMVMTEGELTQAIIDKWQENEALLIKMLVYAGIVGDSLATGLKSRHTLDEVGEYIGDASDAELYEVWRVFLSSEGFNIIKSEEGEKKN